MTDFDTANLIYLIVLGSAVAVWFVAQNRNSLGKVTQQALVWGLIILGTIALVGMWDHIERSVMPRQTVFGETGVIELPRREDGHYYLTADVNGQPVEFVVDTGATGIVLTRGDAVRAGFAEADLVFSGTAFTANGMVRTAPVRLDEIAVGAIRDTGVRATVNGGELDQSLLGMDYLQRFTSVEITNGRLILTR